MENITHELLAVSRAAKVLHIGKDTMYKLIADGRIGFIEIGKRKKIPYNELQRFQNRSLTYTKNEPETEHLSKMEIDQFLFPDKKSKNSFNAKDFIAGKLKVSK